MTSLSLPLLTLSSILFSLLSAQTSPSTLNNDNFAYGTHKPHVQPNHHFSRGSQRTRVAETSNGSVTIRSSAIPSNQPYYPPHPIPTVPGAEILFKDADDVDVIMAAYMMPDNSLPPPPPGLTFVKVLSYVQMPVRPMYFPPPYPPHPAVGPMPGMQNPNMTASTIPGQNLMPGMEQAPFKFGLTEDQMREESIKDKQKNSPVNEKASFPSLDVSQNAEQSQNPREWPAKGNKPASKQPQVEVVEAKPAKSAISPSNVKKTNNKQAEAQAEDNKQQQQPKTKAKTNAKPKSQTTPTNPQEFNFEALFDAEDDGEGDNGDDSEVDVLESVLAATFVQPEDVLDDKDEAILKKAQLVTQRMAGTCNDMVITDNTHSNIFIPSTELTDEKFFDKKTEESAKELETKRQIQQELEQMRQKKTFTKNYQLEAIRKATEMDQNQSEQRPHTREERNTVEGWKYVGDVEDTLRRDEISRTAFKKRAAKAHAKGENVEPIVQEEISRRNRLAGFAVPQESQQPKERLSAKAKSDRAATKNNPFSSLTF